MTEGRLYDFVTAVDYEGVFRILDAPWGFADWLAQEGHLFPDFDGVPDDRGNAYRVVARFSSRNKKIEHVAFAGGILYVPGFSVVHYEPMVLYPTGEVVFVLTEDTTP